MADITAPMVPSKAGELDQLGLYKTYLANAKVRLFQDSLVPTPDTTEATFVANEADFTGYAAAVPTYSAVGIDAEGNYQFVTSRMFFQATDAVAPNSIGGYWLESAAGVLQAYGTFNPPISMESALAFLSLTILINAVPGGVGDTDF